MRVLTLVGARPQFVKAAPVSRALRVAHEERLVHSGQHWDDALSRVFFQQLDLPAPDVHLGVAGMSTAERLGHITRRTRAEVRAWRPDVVLVYGDTDTTLAGALAARAEGVPLAHIEAGLRSGDRKMPEEINRVAVDHVSDVLLCPTRSAASTLRSERATGAVIVVGDVMLDALLETPAEIGAGTLERLSCEPGAYLLATIHRAANTDDPERLTSLLRALDDLGRDVVLPCHPRTRAAITDLPVPCVLRHVRLIAPLGRIEMIALLRHAAGVLTDSGGVQKEAWFLGVPCITLRQETEWGETLEGGWNVLVGAHAGRITEAVRRLGDARLERDLDVFGGGRAAGRVVDALEARWCRG